MSSVTSMGFSTPYWRFAIGQGPRSESPQSLFLLLNFSIPNTWFSVMPQNKDILTSVRTWSSPAGVFKLETWVQLLICVLHSRSSRSSCNLSLSSPPVAHEGSGCETYHIKVSGAVYQSTWACLKSHSEFCANKQGFFSLLFFQLKIKSLFHHKIPCLFYYFTFQI